MQAIEKLTDLQKELGYTQGPLNLVALLGLFGEAGEVLNETVLLSDSAQPEKLKQMGVACAELIDDLKKLVRKSQLNVPITIQVEYEEKFDKELADTLYYLNILAMNRGKDLGYYAQLSYDKVSKKMQK